jgi:hypothetical protein
MSSRVQLVQLRAIIAGTSDLLGIDLGAAGGMQLRILRSEARRSGSPSGRIPELDWITPESKNDWDGLGGRLHRQRGVDSSRRDDVFGVALPRNPITGIAGCC